MFFSQLKNFRDYKKQPFHRRSDEFEEQEICSFLHLKFAILQSWPSWTFKVSFVCHSQKVQSPEHTVDQNLASGVYVFSRNV